MKLCIYSLTSLLLVFLNSNKIFSEVCAHVVNIIFAVPNHSSRLKLSSKGVLFMNGSQIRPPVSFVWDQTSTVRELC